MLESLSVSTLLPAPPERVYRAWLDSQAHTDFSGGVAIIDPEPGGHFSAWDGYIHGANLELDPPRRILQSWRTSDFPEESPDSQLEVVLEEQAGGTLLTLRHSGIPEGQAAEYEQGWLDFYFAPMKAYFAANDGGDG